MKRIVAFVAFLLSTATYASGSPAKCGMDGFSFAIGFSAEQDPEECGRAAISTALSVAHGPTPSVAAELHCEKGGESRAVDLSRYTCFLSLPFDEPAPDLEVIPEAAALVRLKRAADRSRAATGRNPEALAKDIEAWRRVLSHATSSFWKVLASRMVESGANLSELRLRGSEPLCDALRPLSREEWSVEAVYKKQIGVFHRNVDAYERMMDLPIREVPQTAAGHLVDESALVSVSRDWRMWFSVRAFDPDETKKTFDSLAAAAISEARERRPVSVVPPPLPESTTEFLFNPIGKAAIRDFWFDWDSVRAALDGTDRVLEAARSRYCSLGGR